MTTNNTGVSRVFLPLHKLLILQTQISFNNQVFFSPSATRLSPKSKATGLHPHQVYNCSIELLSNTLPPRNKIYPLSKARQKAKEEYITEELQQGYITHSSSPLIIVIERKRAEDSDLALITED